LHRQTVDDSSRPVRRQPSGTCERANVYFQREEIECEAEPTSGGRPSAAVMRQSRYVAVGPTGAVQAGQMREFVVEDLEILVVNLDGSFHAFANRCPHQGGPLSKGRLEDGVMICPWHLWRFDARTGRPHFPEGYTGVARYPVKVENGQIFVGVG
jgi:nitrite reductase/ring-hydroxylating ferredoxin subunit